VPSTFKSTPMQISKKPIPPDSAARIVIDMLPALGKLHLHLGLMVQNADVRTPVLIDHVDSTEASYYIVPIHFNGVNQPFAITAVDAASGTVLDIKAVAVGGKDSTLAPHWTVALSGKPTHALRDPQDMTPPNAGFTGRIVWKSCVETRSRFQPLFEMKINGKTHWMDIHGTVHSELHPGRKPADRRTEAPATAPNGQ
jgi:hypothetical protein